VNPDLQKELLARLDALAAKLGVAASDLWAIYGRQAHLQLLENLVGAIISGVLTAIGIGIGLWFLWKWLHSAKDKRYRDGDQASLATLAFGVTLIPAIITVIDATSAFEIWYNPNFWILHQLIGR
jgi:heme/copper-type cytochrome/quinol oxidase subunit 2